MFYEVLAYIFVFVVINAFSIYVLKWIHEMRKQKKNSRRYWDGML